MGNFVTDTFLESAGIEMFVLPSVRLDQNPE